MVEMIGLVVISALIWVLAWAMGAEKSDADRQVQYGRRRKATGGGNASEQPARHAA